MITGFASEASREPYDIEPLTQEFRTSLSENSNTETSIDELALNPRPRPNVPVPVHSKHSLNESDASSVNLKGSDTAIDLSPYPLHESLRQAMRRYKAKSDHGRMSDFRVQSARMVSKGYHDGAGASKSLPRTGTGTCIKSRKYYRSSGRWD